MKFSPFREYLCGDNVFFDAWMCGDKKREKQLFWRRVERDTQKKVVLLILGKQRLKFRKSSDNDWKVYNFFLNSLTNSHNVKKTRYSGLIYTYDCFRCVLSTMKDQKDYYFYSPFFRIPRNFFIQTEMNGPQFIICQSATSIVSIYTQNRRVINVDFFKTDICTIDANFNFSKAFVLEIIHFHVSDKIF